MANEIYQAYDSASTLYAFVYRQSDGYIWDVGDTAFEAIGTWNDARADECDILLTPAGDMHFVDFPSGITDAGNYIVQIRIRAGASPDTDDMILSQGFMIWDGSAEVVLSDVEDKIDIVDSNVDDLILAAGKVNNVYPAATPEQYNPLGKL